MVFSVYSEFPGALHLLIAGLCMLLPAIYARLRKPVKATLEAPATETSLHVFAEEKVSSYSNDERRAA